MLDFARKLYDELIEKIESTDQNRHAGACLTDQRLEWIRAAIDQLKDHLGSHQFPDESEEIQFFKTTLPSFLSLFFFYTEKRELESARLIGTGKRKDEFYEQVIDRIDSFFKENAEFFRYYCSGKSHLDWYYFRRRKNRLPENNDLLASVMDPSFGTVYSVKTATIIAYTRLEQYIKLIRTGKTGEEHIISSEMFKLEWTDSKAGLVELIYSLKEKGVFNHGRAGLKQIIHYFESVFSIQLGNTSSIFQEILSRKTGYTNFLDKLKERLNGRIDDIEEANLRHSS